MIAWLCALASAQVVELSASLLAVGTDRLVVLDTERGRFPGLRAPALGLEACAPLARWEGGLRLGLLARLGAWRSPAVPLPTGGQIRFTLLEPHLGLDLSHPLSEGAASYVRYGGAVALPLLDPSTSGPQVALGGALHLGVGRSLGSGPARPALELQGRVLPRTDGYVTTHHPATALPTFIFFPGSAGIYLMAGLSLGR